MSKKKSKRKKRDRSSRERRAYPRGAPTSTTVREEQPAPAPALQEQQPAMPDTKEPAVDFAAEYQYVRNDLKRIAVLAGTFFTILIVLSFVI